MSSRQIAELRNYVSGWTALGRALLLIIASLAIAAFFRGIVRGLIPSASPAWWMLPTLGMAFLLFVLAKRGTGGRELRERIRADLSNGVLRVTRIRVAEAIEVEEQEDEGPSYFLKTDEGQIYAFSGQYLANLKRRGFPWSEFDLVEAPASQLIFQIKRAGSPIRPVFVREPFTFAEFKTYGGAKYRLLNVEFESLKVKRSPSSA